MLALAKFLIYSKQLLMKSMILCYHNLSNFQLIESQQHHATAIKQKKKNFMQVLDCFNWWSQGNVTAIKMTITTRQKDSKRICRIRGLIGSRKQVAQFIQFFAAKSKKLANSKQTNLQEDQLQSNGQQTNPFYLQSCAIYMFHKILSNEKYGIGNIIYSSINNFNAQYQNSQVAATLIPAPMKKAVNICEQIVQNLYKDFNYGRQQMSQIMPYCRISVQKYTFEKINTKLVNMYKHKNKQITDIFIAKKKKITTQLAAYEILKQIGLAQKLWFAEQKDEKSEESAKQVQSLLKSQTANRYSRAFRQLQRIQWTMSPRQKIKHCQIMYTYLKTVIFEQSHGKQQLINMEDIIPILILVLLLADVSNIKTELDILLDFIEYDPCDLESEKRLLINLSESFNYVSRDWKI